MSRKVNRKFYRPGALTAKGTKISLKTQPYINGIVFNPDDPITSFHSYIALISSIVEEYEILIGIPGLIDSLKAVVPEAKNITPEQIAKIKLLLNYLALSPIEITLKDQLIDKEILATLERSYE